MSRLERIVTYVVVFLSGALLMSLEIAAFRIIGKTFGSALRETTAVIAVFLAAMSVGYWLGGRAGDRWPRSSTLVAVLLNAAALLVGIPWLDAMISPRIASSGIDLSTHAFLATAVLFALPTVLYASVSPIAVRLFAADISRSGANAGSISAVSTIGSIAGSVLTAFFLIDVLESISRTVLAVALTTCATALLLTVSSLPRLKREQRLRSVTRIAVLGVVALLAIGVPALAYIRSTRIDASLLQLDPSWRVLFVGDSPYHRVSVRERPGMTRLLSFGGAAQSRMLLKDPFGPGATYTDSAHIGRLIRPNIRRVLLIGLGGGTIPKQFTTMYPDTTIDVVEIDPMVVDVAKRFFYVTPSDRLRLHVGDGRMFLKRTTETWDLIIVDAYTTNRYGDTLPPHMATREFFEVASQRLTPGGVLHYHCAFGGTRLVPAIQKTIASVFPTTFVSGGETFASRDAVLVSTDVMLQRAEALLPRLPYLRGQIVAFQPYAEVAADLPILTDDYAPVDTLR